MYGARLRKEKYDRMETQYFASEGMVINPLPVMVKGHAGQSPGLHCVGMYVM